MENNNNSKQILLSIIGIAILVVAVVGVSFAFFTYSRKGKTNNIITTGSITFEIKDPDPEDPDNDNPTIKGDNSEPKTDEEGKKDPDPAEVEVEGSLPEGADTVTYYLYAIAGDAPDGHPQGDETRNWKRFKSSQIKLYVTASGDTQTTPEGGAGNITISGGYDKGAVAGEIYKQNDDTGKDVSKYNDENKDGVYEEKGALENGFTLATGTLPAGKTTDHKYKITMWINGEENGGVTISDTDYSKDFRASDTSKGDSPLKQGDPDAVEGTTLPTEKEKDDRLVYSDMYYSLKLKLVATDDPSYQP